MTIHEVKGGHAVRCEHFWCGRDGYWSRLPNVLPFPSYAAAQAYIASR